MSTIENTAFTNMLFCNQPEMYHLGVNVNESGRESGCIYRTFSGADVRLSLPASTTSSRIGYLGMIRGDKDGNTGDDSHRVSLGKGRFLRREGTYFVGVVGSLATPLHIWSAIHEYKEVGISVMRKIFEITWAFS